MAIKKELGSIARIDDLRSVWPNEAQDFTPWLSENLDLLGDALGLSLELTETESAVGTYSLDILAESSDSGEKVIIENQLEQSNHDHLGKLLTYASGKDAKCVVWIVKDARDEHRAAIEWLNKITDDSIGFFLVEVQLWTINDSAPAPKFEIIEEPNNWSKAAKSSGSSSGGAAVQFKYAFWSDFNDYAWKQNVPFTKTFKKHKASSDHWYTLSIGSSQMYMSLLVNTKTNKLTVEFAVASPDYDKTLYDSIESHKEEIEAAVGAKLDWRKLDTKKVSRIILEKQFDLSDKSQRQQQFDWYMNAAMLFRNAFKPYTNI